MKCLHFFHRNGKGNDGEGDEGEGEGDNDDGTDQPLDVSKELLRVCER